MSTADYIIISLIAVLLLVSLFSIYRSRKKGNCCSSSFCGGDCKSCEKSHAAAFAKQSVSSKKNDRADENTSVIKQ